MFIYLTGDVACMCSVSLVQRLNGTCYSHTLMFCKRANSEKGSLLLWLLYVCIVLEHSWIETAIFHVTEILGPLICRTGVVSKTP